MANEQTDYSNQGYFNVTPDNVQKDIVYPTPQDNQQPDIPLHNKTNSQAIANNMNYIYEVIGHLAGLDSNEDLDDVIEKANLPVREDGSINYGRDGEGLAKDGDAEENKNKWIKFAEYEEFNNRAPVGAIILWAGAKNSFPAGWVECDGTDGTPDLRGRVPVGVSGSATGSPRLPITLNEVKGKHNGQETSTASNTYKHKETQVVHGNNFNISGGSTNTGWASDNYVHPASAHNHYIGSKYKNAQGSSKTFWVIGGGTYAWNNLAGYHSHAQNSHYHAQNSHTHNVNHGHSVTGGGAVNAANKLNITQPSIGVYYIMYKGVS